MHLSESRTLANPPNEIVSLVVKEVTTSATDGVGGYATNAKVMDSMAKNCLTNSSDWGVEVVGR